VHSKNENLKFIVCWAKGFLHRRASQCWIETVKKKLKKAILKRKNIEYR
jgi:hypothetical protein